MARKILRCLNKAEQFICVSSILAMLAILTFQVVSRYVLRQSNIWTEELARYLYIWLVFVGTSYAEQEFIHIKIDVLANVFPKKIRPFAALIGELCLLIFSIYMCSIALPYVQSILGRGQISQALKISMAFPYAAIPVGFALLALRVLLNIITKRYVKRDGDVDLGDVDPGMIRQMEDPQINPDGGVS